MRPFIFTHVPRTAGTSLRSLIYRAAVRAGVPPERIHVPGFGGVHYAMNTSELPAGAMEALRRRRLLCLADHNQYGVHDALGIEDPFYYTMLREPVAAAVSYYHFVLEDVVVKRQAAAIRQLRDLLAPREMRRLLGLEEVPSINLCPAKIVEGILGDFEDYGLEILGLPREQAAVGAAIRRLRDDYGCFGITEQFDASLAMLRSTAPAWLELPRDHVALNRGDYRRSELSPRVLRIILSHNELNRRLYDGARELFLFRRRA